MTEIGWQSHAYDMRYMYRGLALFQADNGRGLGNGDDLVVRGKVLCHTNTRFTISYAIARSAGQSVEMAPTVSRNVMLIGQQLSLHIMLQCLTV
jgi:hypothetical protein